jgi:hypothetical protein
VPVNAGKTLPAVIAGYQKNAGCRQQTNIALIKQG